MPSDVGAASPKRYHFPGPMLCTKLPLSTSGDGEARRKLGRSPRDYPRYSAALETFSLGRRSQGAVVSPQPQPTNHTHGPNSQERATDYISGGKNFRFWKFVRGECTTRLQGYFKVHAGVYIPRGNE